MMYTIAPWLLLLLTLLSGSECQITTPPENTVALVDEETVLTCREAEADFISWREAASEITGRYIYRSSNPDNGGIVDPDDVGKYEVITPHDLTIYDASLADGGFYTCIRRDAEEEVASLIVMEPPVLELPNMMEGQSYNLACTVKYGSPPHDFIQEEQIPDLDMAIDGTHKTGGKTTDNVDNVYTVRMETNYTASSADNGKNITCTVSTLSPVYEVTSSMVLDVKFAVKEISYEPQNIWYYVGEMINCSAKGNPAPEFRWTPKLSPGGLPVSNATLTLLSNMVGENRWECSATNTADVIKSITIETDTFEVLASTEPPSTEPPGDGGGGVPAGAIAGVVVLLVLIPVVIVGGLCYWKRQKRKGEGNDSGGGQPGASNKGLEPVQEIEEPADVSLNTTMSSTAAKYYETPTNNQPVQPYPGPTDNPRNSTGYADLHGSSGSLNKMYGISSHPAGPDQANQPRRHSSGSGHSSRSGGAIYDNAIPVSSVQARGAHQPVYAQVNIPRLKPGEKPRIVGGNSTPTEYAEIRFTQRPRVPSDSD